MKRLFILLAVAITMAAFLISCQKSETNEPQSDDTTYDLNGKLPGAFSVNATGKVQFSQGNLQYDTRAKKWQFAAQQYMVQGNENVSADGVRDMFAWQTNGWKTDATWRMLSQQEWNYLINERTNHQNLMRAAKVNNMMGLVLLPDNWSLDALAGQYTAEQWNTLEEAGAVFLPSAGLGSAEDGAISAVGTIGCYWSSTLRDETMAWHLYVLGLTNDIRMASYDIQGTMSIRLVADAVQ